MRVLLIDDSRFDRKIFAALLESLGQEVVTAETIAEGLEHVEGVDLALLDYYLPDVDGLEGLMRIKFARPSLPVCLLTGHDDPETAERAILAGAEDYVSKENIVMARPALLRVIRFAAARASYRAASRRLDILADVRSDLGDVAGALG